MCTRLFTRKLNTCIIVGPECILANVSILVQLQCLFLQENTPSVLIITAISQTCLTRGLMQIVGCRLPVVTKEWAGFFETCFWSGSLPTSSSPSIRVLGNQGPGDFRLNAFFFYLIQHALHGSSLDTLLFVHISVPGEPRPRPSTSCVASPMLSRGEIITLLDLPLVLSF